MKSKETFLKIWFRRICRIVMGGLVLTWLTPFVATDSSVSMLFIGLSYPFLMVSAIILIAFALLMRLRNEAIWLGIVMLIGFVFLRRNVQLSLFSTEKFDKKVRIMSWNIGNAPYRLGSPLSNAVEKVMPDIVCIQEMHPKAAFKLYPFSAISSFNVRIYSQYPILRQGTVVYKFQHKPSPYTDEDGAVWADIQIGEKIIRVYSVHLISYNMTYVIDQTATEFDAGEGKTWSRGFKILKKMAKVAPARAQQARELAAHIQKSPYPVIVTGDFNECPQSYVYSVLGKNLNDAFVTDGNGFGWTYNKNIPMLKIDFTLYDPRLKVVAHEIRSQDFTSDHFAQITDFGF